MSDGLYGNCKKCNRYLYTPEEGKTSTCRECSGVPPYVIHHRDLLPWCPECKVTCKKVDEDGCCLTCGWDVMGPFNADSRERGETAWELERQSELRKQAEVACERRTHDREVWKYRALSLTAKEAASEYRSAALAWHNVVKNEEGHWQCTSCLSPGDDECPVMKVIKELPNPFPDEPEDK